MNKKLILIFCMLLLVLTPLVMAKDFVINKDIFMNGKSYKLENSVNISNLWVVNMLPGDLMVAGCFFKFYGGGF